MMDPSTGSKSHTKHQAQHHADSDFSLRSFRWRVQLGLLPPSVATDNPADNPGQWPAVLAQQREDYQRLVEQHPYPDEQEQLMLGDNGSPDPTAITESAFDPLTAMLMEEQEKSERLQELDLKYRREKALRKRGYGNNGNKVMEDEEYDEQAAALQIIDKDLDRLPSPRTKRQSHASASEALSLSSPSSSSPLSSNQSNYQNNEMSDDNMVDVGLDDDDNNDDEYSQRKRRAVLRQVLFVYTCEHPDPGYRQGMHEIASYLLHALQLDQEVLLRLERATTYTASASALTATTEDLSADTYTMLVHILTAILPSYDVGPSPQSQPLPAMSRRILNILQEHCPELHYMLTELDTPPQLYLTKWIRLLYSREVTQVLELWDELFFPSVSVTNTTTGKHTWMEVLECTAAARLLLWRQPILQSPDASHRLHLLMNLPVQADIAPLVQLTQQLLEYPVRRSVVVLPDITNAANGLVGASASIDAPVRPTTTTSSSTGLHPLQEHSITTPTDQGHHQFASNQHDGDLGAAASALANRFSLSAVKQSLEQAKTQTESIKKQLYQGWGSLAVATNNSDHQYQSNNTGSTQQQQQQNNNYSNFNTGTSARKPNVTGDPSRRNYDDPSMGGIDWSGGQQSHQSSSAAVLHPQLNGERQTPYASNESPSRVSHHVQHGQQHPQAWAQSIQASSSVLQDFVMAMEKQSAEQGGNISNDKVVPAAVWEALADLEVLRRDMLSSSGSSTTDK